VFLRHELIQNKTKQIKLKTPTINSLPPRWRQQGWKPLMDIYISNGQSNRRGYHTAKRFHPSMPFFLLLADSQSLC